MCCPSWCAAQVHCYNVCVCCEAGAASKADPSSGGIEVPPYAPADDDGWPAAYDDGGDDSTSSKRSSSDRPKAETLRAREMDDHASCACSNTPVRMRAASIGAGSCQTTSNVRTATWRSWYCSGVSPWLSSGGSISILEVTSCAATAVGADAAGSTRPGSGSPPTSGAGPAVRRTPRCKTPSPSACPAHPTGGPAPSRAAPGPPSRRRHRCADRPSAPPDRAAAPRTPPGPDASAPPRRRRRRRRAHRFSPTRTCV